MSLSEIPHRGTSQFIERSGEIKRRPGSHTKGAELLGNSNGSRRDGEGAKPIEPEHRLVAREMEDHLSDEPVLEIEDTAGSTLSQETVVFESSGSENTDGQVLRSELRTWLSPEEEEDMLWRPHVQEVGLEEAFRSEIATPSDERLFFSEQKRDSISAHEQFE